MHIISTFKKLVLTAISIAAASSMATERTLTNSNLTFGQAQQQVFLPVDQAFTLAVEPGEQSYELVWKIAPNYYLYKRKFKILANTNSETTDLTHLAKFARGIRQTDDYFGQVEVFYNQAVVSLPREALTAATDKLVVEYQGCAEAGLCYPVQTKTLELLGAN